MPDTPPSSGVRARIAHRKEFDGIVVEAVEWLSDGPSAYDLTCARCRLGVVLEQAGGMCETRTSPNVPGGYSRRGQPFVSLSPPDMPVWACSDGIRYTRSLSLAFDRAALRSWLGEEVAQAVNITPRLNFAPGRMSSLAEILESECRTAAPLGDLYADGLILAVLVEVVRLGRFRDSNPAALKLAPWQLRLATDYMAAQIGARVLLKDVARLTGLSQWHFSRAFRASTGLPPYQWHLQSRIRHTKRLLLDERRSIADIATETGFADQAHFTRVFRRLSGTTPALWRRERHGRLP